MLYLFRHFARECARHQGSQFTDNGVHRRFVVGKRVCIDDAGLLFLGNTVEFGKGCLFLFVICRIPKFHHLFEIGAFVAAEFHGACHTREPDTAKRRFPFAYELEVRRRGKSGILRKFTPRKAGLLLFFVEVPHIATVILIFGYRLHNSYPFINNLA